MSKFRIKMKLQGFELDVEGHRDDMPLIAQSVGQQIAGILEPATFLAGKEPTPQIVPPSTQAVVRNATRRRKTTGGPTATSEAVDWRHDPQKWGTPKQAWVTADKAMWLLRVCGDDAGRQEMTATEIAATFNKHFKQAGVIQGSKVTRDLGRKKISKDSPVAEDTSKAPSQWYLTQAGKGVSDALVQQALGTA